MSTQYFKGALNLHGTTIRHTTEPGRATGASPRGPSPWPTRPFRKKGIFWGWSAERATPERLKDASTEPTTKDEPQMKMHPIGWSQDN
eukprot:CAMPEP_0204315234 /NCGR_PEP_ID=MMETSP0469-20131031/4695_1 /ASSEMBLY_ACC=CAM_ASM_000384 /TAXON_ID=2969 /ORGANISM="Oxyrrhis marina" /LENGTH=87 /DNA_ID=CAMNT_0051295845 /DNA_START=327 /DNA_END=590 /DNA_ORIENTATION=+